MVAGVGGNSGGWNDGGGLKWKNVKTPIVRPTAPLVLNSVFCVTTLKVFCFFLKILDIF